MPGTRSPLGLAFPLLSDFHCSVLSWAQCSPVKTTLELTSSKATEPLTGGCCHVPRTSWFSDHQTPVPDVHGASASQKHTFHHRKRLLPAQLGRYLQDRE